MEEFKKMWKNYAVFSGRSTRRDFWMAVLFNFLTALIVGIIANIIHLSALSLIYSLAVFIPGLALSVRRLHDINKSGWFLLLALIPLVGAIIVIVFYCLPTVEENNQYGDVVE